ncbi:FG-GAP repeat protein [Streptomyces sp. NPDC054794]
MLPNRRFQSLLAAFAVLSAALVPAATAAASPRTSHAHESTSAVAPGGAATRADVTGDGIPDTVVSTGARLTFAGDPNAEGLDKGGSIYVIPGGGTLPAGPAVAVSQDSHDFVPGTGESDDTFGASLVTGDFNGDGLADVAVGNPSEGIGSNLAVGMVTILYGKRQSPYLGLIPNGLAQIDQGVPGIPGDNEAGDRFGASLAVGDFDADGFADLAVGAPGEAIGGTQRAGAVTVLFGTGNGITASRSVGISQDSTGVPGAPETGDKFGWSVASGDVTGDAKDDLVVSAPGEAISGVSNAWGGVVVIPGSSGGVNAAATSSISVQDTNTQDHLRTVAVGRFHGGNNADVLVFADRATGTPQYSGALVVARGGSGGISPGRVQTISQSSPGIPGTPEENDFFGGSLAVGDLDGDGYADLATGSLRENNTGTVTLLRGGGAGLLSAPGATFDENAAAIGASAQVGEGFGYGLRILDVTGDGRPELLVTAPWEDGSLQAGALFVLNTALGGDSLAVTGSQVLTRGALGAGSNFGPATPFAGGAVVTLDSNEQPQRAPRNLLAAARAERGAHR